MKAVTAVLSLLMLSSMASAQSPDPSKWMCRNLSESGGFLYQGETIFGSQACRPIQQTAPAAESAAPAESTPSTPSRATATEMPKQDTSAETSVAVAATTSAATPPTGFLLEDGTPVHLVLSQNLSSADAVTGQTVEFEVVDDVIVNGFVVIPHGSTAWATVTNAEHKRRMERAGKLDIDKVRLADGEKALLRAVKDAEGGGHTGAMVGAMVATSLVVWPAAPVTIPKGTNVNAFVQGDMTLDQSKFQRQLDVAK
jgi:hypothetical protein